MIWKNIDYNIGDGYDSSNGKFKAPVDGIYFFHSQCRTWGTNYSYMQIHVNGSAKQEAYRHENHGYDTVTATSQFKLNKGDTVNIKFGGKFNWPSHSNMAFFEGHLIRQIND